MRLRPGLAVADVWHCVEHGCELVDAEAGSWCPAGEHSVPDVVLAVWEGMHDVAAAELGEAWPFLRSLP
jgi:hypothetical protein